MSQALGILSRCTFLLLCLRLCLCQHDCTGVDCPQLDSCIEEALESGACCASCLQKGCTCEGYQYYDCINAGFKNGKVPEGDSYFVDYGSTECSCPVGGGRISCHFISCPDLPPNCIEVLEPADGCMQCERVGCAENGQKYEAGHSFHIDPCRVCHCPNDGGKLMCYPVPSCDPQKVDQPTLAAPTEEDPAGRRETSPYGIDQHPHTVQTSTEDHPLANGNLPLFKSSPLDKEEPDEYDFDPTDFPESIPESLIFPTPSSSSSSSEPSNKVVPLYPESVRPNRTFGPQSPSRPGRLELRERHGVRDYPAGSVKVTEDPRSAEQSAAGPQVQTTTPGQSAQAPFSDGTTETDPKHASHVTEPLSRSPEDLPANPGSAVPPLELTETEAHRPNTPDSPTPKGPNTLINAGPHLESTDRRTDQGKASDEVQFPLNVLETTEPPVHSQTSPPGHKGGLSLYDDEEEEDEEEIVTLQTVSELKGEDQPDGTTLPYNERRHEGETSTTESVTPVLMVSEYQTTPAVQLGSPSVQTAAGVEPSEGQTSEKPGTTAESFHSQGVERKVPQEAAAAETGRKPRPDSSIKHPEGPGGPEDDPLSRCCAAGQAWAARHRHCDGTALPDGDQQSVCDVVQKQCCLSSLKETRCEAGVVSARRREPCAAAEEESCAGGSFQVCCSCCSLGLRLRGEGRGCHAHQYLGDPCSHVFLTCCEEDEGSSRVPLRRKLKPRPTALPQQVADGKFPKEAFSIGATDDAANAANAVEQQQQDECHLHGRQLCQHTCSNARDSYRCGCHPGYLLQPDRRSCAPVDPEEDNRVGAADRAAAGPVWTVRPSPPTTTTTTGVRVHPCAENNPCSQRCTAVSGQARCSCFPGFRLTSAGHTCEDVDECVTGTHRCGRGQRCVNTLGSFVCEQRAACPAGHQLTDGVCEDMDECLLGRHDCASNTVCENTAGSFLCRSRLRCMSGFSQDSHGNCVDVNECVSLRDPCSSASSCVNTVGSFTCQKKSVACSHGFRSGPDGGQCVDVDECLMGTHRCGTGQICHNLPGTYRCDCQTGYQFDAILKACADVDECWRFPGRLCAQTCENSPGSYRCSCTSGFSLALDGKSCEDVNECEKKPCSQECANIYGSYQCYCQQGYYLKEDGHTCEDIDECSQPAGSLCSFQCVNVDGSYRCSCPPQGYAMSANGRTCSDIDECTTGSHNCSSTQSCFNLQGSFRCLSFHCPLNYRKVSDTRCERLGCPSGSPDCPDSPVRISFYRLSFQTDILVPAQIFRIGPSPAYSGDHVAVSITGGDPDGYFATRKLNSFTGAVYLQRRPRRPRDFLIDVEMKLLRQGTLSTFLNKIYVFITSSGGM